MDSFGRWCAVREQFNIMLRARKLSQQYLVDIYAKIETGRLLWIRKNQIKLRAKS